MLLEFGFKISKVLHTAVMFSFFARKRFLRLGTQVVPGLFA